MDRAALRLFVRLTETENMTLTAAELGLPQPTLSRTLSRLERVVGCELFTRHGRKLRLNAHGKAFLPHARAAVTSMEAGERALRALDDPSRGTIRLGFLYSLGAWLVPAVLTEFRALAPMVLFRLHQGSADDLRDLLLDDELDVILTAPRPAGAGWQPLIRQELVIASSPGHPVLEARDASGAVSLTEAARHPFLALSPRHGMQRLVDRLFADAGATPKPAFEGTDLATLRGLAAAGLGLAILPFAAQEETPAGAGTIVQTRVSGADAHRDIGMSTRPASAPTPALSRFCAFLADESPTIAGHRGALVTLSGREGECP